MNTLFNTVFNLFFRTD